MKRGGSARRFERSSSLKLARKFKQQSAEPDHRKVRMTKMLFRPVDNRTHTFLNGGILILNAINAGIAFVALFLAIYTEIVPHAEGGMIVLVDRPPEAVVAFEELAFAIRKGALWVSMESPCQVVSSSMGTHACP